MKDILLYIKSDYQRYKGVLGGVKIFFYIYFLVVIIALITVFGFDLHPEKTYCFL